MKRTPAALLVVFIAAAGNPVHALDLTPAAILTRVTAVYARVSAYSDHGTVSRDESWPWIMWHMVRYGRAHDEFRTAFVRGRMMRFVYSPVGDPETRVDNTGDLVALSGVSHGASSAVPLLLVGYSQTPIRRLTALQRRADTKIGNRPCFTVTGALQGGGAHASYTLYIDQRTYFLRRVTREVVGHGTTSTNTTDYLR